MDSNVIRVGDKIDIRMLQQVELADSSGQNPVVYKSKVQDIKKDDFLEVSMPTNGGKMVLLPAGVRYEFIFYTKAGLYRCIAQIKERYKVNNLFMLLIEPKSPLEKFQRREYFRFGCAMDMEYQQITEEESRIADMEQLKKTHKVNFPEDSIRHGIAVDLSGGGIRFVGEEELQREDFLFISIFLRSTDADHLLEVAGRILSCRKVEAAPNSPKKEIKYEYRVQFLTRDQKKREMIIKYIFEQERKNRQKG